MGRIRMLDLVAKNLLLLHDGNFLLFAAETALWCLFAFAVLNGLVQPPYVPLASRLKTSHPTTLAEVPGTQGFGYSLGGVPRTPYSPLSDGRDRYLPQPFAWSPLVLSGLLPFELGAFRETSHRKKRQPDFSFVRSTRIKSFATIDSLLTDESTRLNAVLHLAGADAAADSLVYALDSSLKSANPALSGSRREHSVSLRQLYNRLVSAQLQSRAFSGAVAFDYFPSNWDSARVNYTLLLPTGTYFAHLQRHLQRTDARRNLMQSETSVFHPSVPFAANHLFELFSGHQQAGFLTRQRSSRFPVAGVSSEAPAAEQKWWPRAFASDPLGGLPAALYWHEGVLALLHETQCRALQLLYDCYHKNVTSDEERQQQRRCLWQKSSTPTATSQVPSEQRARHKEPHWDWDRELVAAQSACLRTSDEAYVTQVARMPPPPTTTTGTGADGGDVAEAAKGPLRALLVRWPQLALGLSLVWLPLIARIVFEITRERNSRVWVPVAHGSLT